MFCFSHGRRATVMLRVTRIPRNRNRSVCTPSNCICDAPEPILSPETEATLTHLRSGRATPWQAIFLGLVCAFRLRTIRIGCGLTPNPDILT
jgi:hypothetical protein